MISSPISLGTMQGRLSPPEDEKFQAFPRAQWREEFARAQELGMTAIEWIYDSHGDGFNPLENSAGIARIKELSRRHGVMVRSVCADYLMENAFAAADENGANNWIACLQWLLNQCAQAGIERIVLPFVDNAALRSQPEKVRAAAALKAVLPDAERHAIELHLETDLGPHEFAQFLALAAHALIKVNYDSGNSASLGYNVLEEYSAYGARIGSFHIKDRVRGGGTVPLGEGAVHWPDVFQALQKSDYAGDFILQVARGKAGDEIEWTRRNQLWFQEAARCNGFAPPD